MSYKYKKGMSVTFSPALSTKVWYHGTNADACIAICDPAANPNGFRHVPGVRKNGGNMTPHPEDRGSHTFVYLTLADLKAKRYGSILIVCSIRAKLVGLCVTQGDPNAKLWAKKGYDFGFAIDGTNGDPWEEGCFRASDIIVEGVVLPNARLTAEAGWVSKITRPWLEKVDNVSEVSTVSWAKPVVESASGGSASAASGGSAVVSAASAGNAGGKMPAVVSVVSGGNAGGKMPKPVDFLQTLAQFEQDLKNAGFSVDLLAFCKRNRMESWFDFRITDPTALHEMVMRERRLSPTPTPLSDDDIAAFLRYRKTRTAKLRAAVAKSGPYPYSGGPSCLKTVAALQAAAQSVYLSTFVPAAAAGPSSSTAGKAPLSVATAPAAAAAVKTPPSVEMQAAIEKAASSVYLIHHPNYVASQSVSLAAVAATAVVVSAQAAAAAVAAPGATTASVAAAAATVAGAAAVAVAATAADSKAAGDATAAASKAAGDATAAAAASKAAADAAAAAATAAASKAAVDAAAAAAAAPDAGMCGVSGCVRASWSAAHPGSACCRKCSPGKPGNSDHGPSCNDMHNMMQLSMGGA